MVGAGLGTRLRPLTNLCPKPALPVRGIPLVGYQLALLARHGVTEVIVNTHHLSDHLIEAARGSCPDGVELHFSVEDELLGTGGGIRRVAAFLRESDPSIIIGGDQVLDLDLTAFIAKHRSRGDAATLQLLDDPRAAAFGPIGVDAEGSVRRVANRFDLGGEVRSGLYTWVNAIAPRAFDWLPDREVFSHLDHWLIPRVEAGERDVRGEVATRDTCVWVPVGTPAEYLEANLTPRPLSYLDVEAVAEQRGVRFTGDVVVGAGATIARGASLRRTVIWDGEQVPALPAADGVFAGGAFHTCSPAASGADADE